MYKGMSLKTSCDLACSKILKVYVLIVSMLIKFKVYKLSLDYTFFSKRL